MLTAGSATGSGFGSGFAGDSAALVVALAAGGERLRLRSATALPLSSGPSPSSLGLPAASKGSSSGSGGFTVSPSPRITVKQYRGPAPFFSFSGSTTRAPCGIFRGTSLVSLSTAVAPGSLTPVPLEERSTTESPPSSRSRSSAWTLEMPSCLTTISLRLSALPHEMTFLSEGRSSKRRGVSRSVLSKIETARGSPESVI
mmetsp:Transcript_142839/g.456463  ORF Transcript_142839/g.456463 Transcript_142839/m.456463 type:complete len:200 (-) Transcript_142839:67-666(-)